MKQKGFFASRNKSEKFRSRVKYKKKRESKFPSNKSMVAGISFENARASYIWSRQLQTACLGASFSTTFAPDGLTCSVFRYLTRELLLFLNEAGELSLCRWLLSPKRMKMYLKLADI